MRLWQVLLLLVLSLAVQARPAEKDISIDTHPPLLKPQRAASETLHLSSRFLEYFHYKPRRLSDDFSADILQAYLDTLDPNRSFFLASDIEHFSAYRHQLDEAIRDSDPTPPFAMFNVYAERVRQRVKKALELLERPMDFSVDETYRFDRTEAPWAASEADLDEIWRKRVKNDWLNLKLAGKDDGKIHQLLRKRYTYLYKRVAGLGADRVMQMFMNAWTTSIEPHTGYMSPRTTESFNINMRLSLEGIGAVLQSDNELTKVVRVVKGGPADKQGELKAGDRIIGVRQQDEDEFTDVVGWWLDDVVDLIRGPKNTRVSLQILPAGSGLDGPVKIITIQRDKVKLEDQAAKARVIRFKDEQGTAHQVGVIYLPAFYMDFAGRARGEPDYRSTTRDVRKLLEQLKALGVEGVIVDLRNNGGGSLLEANQLTGLFIDRGPVVQVRNQRGVVDVQGDEDAGVTWSGPLAVLINRNSASASEIFAAAIQDYGRGLVLGENSFGKGTVQDLINLDRYADKDQPELGQLRLTMAQFFRVDGGSTQLRGVKPDLDFGTLQNSKPIGERAFKNPLPWTRIEPAEFQPWPANVRNWVEPLSRLHRQRTAASPAWQALMEDWKRYWESQEDTTVSLNMAKRKAEWDADEARRKASQEKMRQSHDQSHMVMLQLDAQGRPRPMDEDVVKVNPAEDALAESRGEGDQTGDLSDVDLILEESARVVADFAALLSAGRAQVAAGKRP